MNYISVCSGIEAATVAWEPLGWKALAYSDIDSFCQEFLRYRYPEVPLYSDFTEINAEDFNHQSIDLLVGGTPCQSFSFSGFRKGLDDERGNLALQFFRLAQRTKPKWILWENVAGALTSGGGRDFQSILRALDELGYGYAWRILDARNFGVPQQRRRLFLVGYLGDWRPPAAALFEPECLQGNSKEKCQVEEKNVTETGASYNDESKSKRQESILKGIPLLAKCITTEYRISVTNDTFVTDGDNVRRLTSIELERLMGFPDNYTLIPYKGKPASYDRRHKVIGNSMAVPVMRWIGERIDQVEKLITHE